jgi:hypothetical protein
MFCLEALVSGQRWVERVTANLARWCGIAVVTTVVVAPQLAVGAAWSTSPGTA